MFKSIFRKILTLLFAAITVFAVLFNSFVIFAANSAAVAELGEVKSQAYIVMEARTGQILVEKNAHLQKYPASITKILTVLAACENGTDKLTTTVTETSAAGGVYNSSSFFVTPGEEIAVNDLIYATMLESANDAANAIAEATSGNIESFAELMNTTATEAGALNSSFTNPSGLHEEGHYSTAYDMAVITRRALAEPNFLKYFGAKSYMAEPTNLRSYSFELIQKSSLVKENKTYYNILGGKLGWTPEAHNTIVTVAEHDGQTLICVAMDSVGSGDKYSDSELLFNYCFANFYMAEIEVAGVLPQNSFLEESVFVNLPGSVQAEDLIIKTAPQGSFADDEFVYTAAALQTQNGLFKQNILLKEVKNSTPKFLITVKNLLQSGVEFLKLNYIFADNLVIFSLMAFAVYKIVQQIKQLINYLVDLPAYNKKQKFSKNLYVK